MGFWSTLGKIALPVAGIAAAPFTGGASLLGTLGSIGGNVAKGINAALPVAGAIGSVASGAAKGGADQRLREQSGLLSEANIRRAQASDQYEAGLSSAKFDREGQDRAKKQQILMTLLGNTKDQSITPGNPAIAGRMPTVTGGARPSNLTGNSEALMQLLGQPQSQAPTYQAPPSFALPQAGAGEKILGGVGLGSSLLSALGPLLAGIGQGEQPEQLGNLNDIIDRLGGRNA
jgi:hypothetical protein